MKKNNENQDNEVVRDSYVANCVRVFKAPNGSVQQKISFMEKKGATTSEWLEAMNQVTNGEVVKAALKNS